MFCPSSRKVPGRNELGVALLGGRSAELRFGVSELLRDVVLCGGRLNLNRLGGFDQLDLLLRAIAYNSDPI
jgi:hypothetical protein